MWNERRPAAWTRRGPARARQSVRKCPAGSGRVSSWARRRAGFSEESLRPVRTGAVCSEQRAQGPPPVCWCPWEHWPPSQAGGSRTTLPPRLQQPWALGTLTGQFGWDALAPTGCWLGPTCGPAVVPPLSTRRGLCSVRKAELRTVREGTLMTWCEPLDAAGPEATASGLLGTGATEALALPQPAEQVRIPGETPALGSFRGVSLPSQGLNHPALSLAPGSPGTSWIQMSTPGS